MNSSTSFALLGLLADTPTPDHIRIRKGYAVCRDGVCEGVFKTLPEAYRDFEILDYGDRLILPGFTDLHLHAPQYAYCATAMDVELIEWLNRYTFPEESRYADLDYARKGYQAFVHALRESMTTRACVFASIHTDATLELMRQLREAGLCAYVGKLNMDRNSPDFYREPDTATSIAETRRWLDACPDTDDELVRPILTPRFTPSVTDETMRQLGQLAAKYRVPAQSHLSENLSEIEWVRALCPDTKFYGETYDRFGLFGGDTPTIMAHCIYSGEEETALMKARGVMIAHCPTSNVNVIAGAAPAAKYLRGGWRIGLGSDVSGGHTLNLLAVMVAAIQVSKLRWRYIDSSETPLTLSEALYMATAGGGSFFGKVGLFEPGYAFDAVVADESGLESILDFSPEERLERLTYLGSGKPLAKFVAGRRIL